MHYAPTANVGMEFTTNVCEFHNVHRGNFFNNGKFTAPVVYMAFNKYVTMSKILFITLGCLLDHYHY